MAAHNRFLSSRSQRQAGSDALFEYECDPCKFDGTVSEGISYCKTCREFLCEDCFAAHRKARATRSHDFIQGKDLRKVQGATPTLDFEFCAKHPGSLVDHYCAAHDEVFCRDCRVITHSGCREVKSISEASRGIKRSKEADLFAGRMESLEKRLTALSTESKRNLDSLAEQKEGCLKKIERFRNQINKVLDKLENDLKQRVIAIATKDTGKLQDRLTTLDTLGRSLGRATQNLKDARASGSEQHTFIAMKKAALHELIKPLDAIAEQQCTVTICFQPHDLLQELVTSLESFGNLETGYNDCLSNRLQPSMRDQSLKEIAKINVRLSDDVETCTITGAVALPTGECLICDFTNKRIKLLDTDITVVRSSISLSSRPKDVAVVTPTKAIVSLPDEEQLQFVSVPDLKLTSKVEIGKCCWGLAVHKNNIFVTCDVEAGDGEVLILTEDGVVQKRIGRNSDGTYMLSSPHYISVDHLGERLYVSHYRQHSVTCLTKEGIVVYNHVFEEAEVAKGVLVDVGGGLFVCSRDKKTVSLQVLTPAGKKYRTLMTWPYPALNPVTFCYRSSDRTLLVGQHENDNVLVYRFV